LPRHEISTQRLILITLATAASLLAACGGPPLNPATLLRQAKHAIDSAPSAHFELTSSGATGSGTALVGGEGDVKRPDSFQGTLQVSAAGFDVDVQVVSVGGTFYARDPLTGRFGTANPASYGFGDPAQLLSPETGLSSLLLLCQSAATRDDDRYNGEQLHEVACSLPGHPVAALLTSADPSQPVSATFGIDASNGQLRRVVLTGPFYSANTLSTYILVVANYGENVTVTPPATAS
jgi:lipoprotein LprG